jgi:Putative bacterial sensory transduction regulator
VADEIILPEAVTKDMLQALFTEAYMDVSLDSDGDIVVKQSYRCYVVPATDGRFIRLYSLFKPNPDATAENKLAFVNRVNDELIIVRAYVTDSGGFGFEWYIPIEGGVTKKLIVLAVQRFHRMLDSAIGKDDKNVVG